MPLVRCYPRDRAIYHNIIEPPIIYGSIISLELLTSYIRSTTSATFSETVPKLLELTELKLDPKASNLSTRFSFELMGLQEKVDDQIEIALSQID